MEESISHRGLRSPSRLPLMRIALVLAALCFVTAAAAVAYLIFTGGSDSDDTVVVTSVTIEPPAGWVVTPLTEADQGAGLILKLDNVDHEASFLGRMVVAHVGEDFNITQLGVDTEAALLRDIEGVTITSNDVVQLGDFEAVKVVYRQAATARGDDDAESFRTSMVIVPTENQTFYLTLRSPSDAPRSLEADGDLIVQRILSAVAALN